MRPQRIRCGKRMGFIYGAVIVKGSERRACYTGLQQPSTETAMGTLTIRLDDKLERELNQLARKQRRTKSEIAREMLRRHLFARRLDDIRAKLRPYAEAAGCVTDEDFFRNIS